MNRRSAVSALASMTVIWGLTFVVVKDALAEVPPLEFLAIRFALALGVLLAVSLRRTLPWRDSLGPGALAGAALACGYALQTLGLRYTGATRAGLITGLYVVLTPPLQALLLRRAPSRRATVAAAIAAAGLALMASGPRALAGFGTGDFMMVGCAFAFALHIVALGRFAPRSDPLALTVVQLAVSTPAFAAAAAASEKLVIPASSSVIYALVLTGIVASALGFLVQARAQASLSATQTAVTLALEPVFAGLFGYLILGERLRIAGWAGAILILGAMIGSAVNGEPARTGRGQIPRPRG